MMKNLLKKITLILAFSASAISFAQINVSFTDPGTLMLATDGTLSGGTISFVVSNIPNSITNTVQVRTYKQLEAGESYNRGGFVGVMNMTLNSDTADSSNSDFSFTTVPNPTNSATHIDRTYTITNIPTTGATIEAGMPHIITLRFNNAGPGGSTPIPGSFVSPPASMEGGDPKKHALHELHILSVPLSLKRVDAIEGAIINTDNNSISVTGANLDAVYSLTGQKTRTTNLTHGIYIVKISKEYKQAIIKVSL